MEAVLLTQLNQDEDKRLLCEHGLGPQTYKGVVLENGFLAVNPPRCTNQPAGVLGHALPSCQWILYIQQRAKSALLADGDLIFVLRLPLEEDGRQDPAVNSGI